MDMRTASTTQLRRNLSELIRDVTFNNQPLAITDYNVPVAILIPIPTHLKHDPKGVAEAVVAALEEQP